MTRTKDITLDDARRIIRRGIDKGEQLGLRGGLAVVGASGALISASRLDRGGAGGMTRARSKAWIAATQQIPSTEHLERLGFIAPPVAQGFPLASPEAIFPGAGGMPIRRDGDIVGAIAASGATVSPFFPPHLDAEQLSVDGAPANPEDLLIHYALGLPYVGQHGDDRGRWERQRGAWDESVRSRAMDEAPPATRQTEHDWAVGLADAVIALAAAEGLRVTVAVVDHRGDPVQQDAMDGAATAGSFVAAAVAAAAATFQTPSGDLTEWYPPAGLESVLAALPYPVAAVAGGVPLRVDGEVVGGLGVAGVRPAVAAALAEQAASSAR